MATPFHASANMRLAVDAIRRLCPTAGIRAVNLLARIRKGTYRGRLFLVKSVFRVSSLIFFGFRHEECRPVVCFTGCPSCRT